MSESAVTACLVVIGNEILSGRTRDANLAFLGERLNRAGIRMTEARVIPDIEARIVETVNEVRRKYDYVFTTGGIGPTHDDITAGCIAKAFGRPLIQNPEALRLLEDYYPEGQLNEGRMRMTRTPEGAILLDNPVSAAPGFQVENVFVMAGIPRIMQAMVEGFIDRLEGGRPVLSRTLIAPLPESRLFPGLSALQARYPDVDMGSYPGERESGFFVSLVLRCVDETRLDGATAELDALIREHGAEPEPG